MGKILSYKHGENSVSGVDPRLWDIVQNAVAASPYNAIIRSGAEKRSQNGTNHNSGWAVDVTLVDPATGKKLPDYQNGEAFAAYEQYAQLARVYQTKTYPDLNNYLRWGGYFSKDGKATGYGAVDLMHIDIRPSAKGRMALGSWAKGANQTLLDAYPGAATNGGLKGANGSRLVSQYQQQLSGSGGLVPPGALGNESAAGNAPIPANLTRGIDNKRLEYATNVANTPLPRPRPGGLAGALAEGAGLAGGMAANGAPIPATMSDQLRGMRDILSAFPNSAGVAPGDAMSAEQVSSLYGGTMAPQRPFQPGEQRPNADGSYSTEISTTWQLPDGQWVNVPSLWMGPNGPVQFDPNDEAGILGAMKSYEAANGPTFKRFGDVNSAVQEAQSRSAAGGAAAGSALGAPQSALLARGAAGAGPANLQSILLGETSPDAMRVTPRLPDGFDFSKQFSVTPEQAKQFGRDPIPMDQSGIQARAVSLDYGLGSLLGPGAISPSTLSPGGLSAPRPSPNAAAIGAVLNRTAVAPADANPNLRSGNGSFGGTNTNNSSGGSSSASRDPVGSAPNYAQLSALLQNPSYVKTNNGVAGRVALPDGVRPSSLPALPATPWGATVPKMTAPAPVAPRPVAAPVALPAPTSGLTAAQRNAIAALPSTSAPGTGLTAAQRTAMSSLAGTSLSTVSPLMAAGAAAARGVGGVAAPVPAVPPPIPMPAAARPQAVAPIPRAAWEGPAARANAAPQLVQGTNGYWYQPLPDGSYKSMKTQDETLARTRAGGGGTAVLSQVDTGQPANGSQVTGQMTANPTFGDALGNWFGSTLIGRGFNLIAGRPQVPLGGGGLLQALVGPPKTNTPGGLIGLLQQGQNGTGTAGGGLIGGGGFLGAPRAANYNTMSASQQAQERAGNLIGHTGSGNSSGNLGGVSSSGRRYDFDNNTWV